jgi:outer membrane protein OmpA-like peptidoglycan-associated protein
MKRLHLFLIIITVFFARLDAQSDVSVSRKEFDKGTPGFGAAWKHIKSGDRFYSDGGVWYSKALSEYLLAQVYNNMNAELNYKTGVSSLYSDKKEEAAQYFAKAYELKKDVADDILLLLGRALIYSGKFDEAEEKINVWLDSEIKKKESKVQFAKKLLEECSAAKKISSDTILLKIENLGVNFNSDADDYSPAISADGQKLFFASRKAMDSKASNYLEDTKFDENIFVAELSGGKWGVAMPAGKNLKTDYCETPLYIDKSGSILYVYAGYEGEGDILFSEFKKGEWKTPGPVPFGINTEFPETSFGISPSESEIAFISNRKKGGMGGKDIYFITKNGRKWSKPKNAGELINSAYDEESVTYSRGGDTLWFGSAGHNTMGGFDIFYSVRSSSGEWGPAMNAGFPLNTSWNDLFYVGSPKDDSLFYFVSNRSGGFGGFDLYSGRILPPPPSPPAPVIVPAEPPVVIQKRDTILIRDTVVVIKEITKEVPKEVAPVVPVVPPPDTIRPKEVIIYLTGKITDAESGNPIMAKIDVIDFASDAVIATTASSDADGSYRVRLTGKKIFMVDIRSTGFLSDMKKITIPETFTEEFYRLDASLNKVKVGKKVVLNNIFFQLGKAVLTPSSYAELNKLVKILEDNPTMKVEISGHTDNTGSPVINAKLSTDRSRAVVDYLAAKGVDRSRLTYVGIGSDQPVADNATEAGRAKNRRVEFKILEF